MKNNLCITAGILIFLSSSFSNSNITDMTKKEYTYNCFRIGYFIENNKIFYYEGVKAEEVPGADIKTFRQIHSSIGIDRKNVYYGKEIIKGMDLKTLEIYSDVIELEKVKPEVGCYPVIDIKFKDKNGIYIIKHLERDRFELVKYEEFQN